jgi:uncharacterized protein Yka (UPF0111/DUF47 family)
MRILFAAQLIAFAATVVMLAVAWWSMRRTTRRIETLERACDALEMEANSLTRDVRKDALSNATDPRVIVRDIRPPRAAAPAAGKSPE